VKRSTNHWISRALFVAFIFASTTSTAFSSSFALEQNVEDLKARANASAIHESDLPSNVFAAEMIRPFLSELIERSVTFRRQCSKVRNAPLLHIVIELVPSLVYDHCLAVSLVTRYAYGRIDIRMLITVPRAPSSYAEIIGHEFEHALEQIEGLDLRSLASTSGSCVYRHADGSFETKRAHEAGLAVAREFERFRNSSHGAGAANSADGQR
jgi:hypothetical protein